jgi:hypothetical protein
MAPLTGATDDEMSLPLPQCRHSINGGACALSQLVVLDEAATHYTFGCLTCHNITILTRTDFNVECRAEGARQKVIAARKATEKEKVWFNIHRR